MSKTIAIPVTCSCKLQKKFKYTAQLADKQDGPAAVTIQVSCPFTYEDQCARHLTITLPPGVQVKNDGTMFRG